MWRKFPCHLCHLSSWFLLCFTLTLPLISLLLHHHLAAQLIHVGTGSPHRHLVHRVGTGLPRRHAFSSSFSPGGPRDQAWVFPYANIDTSPEGSSQSSLSPVAISGNHLTSAGGQRRSKRIAGKNVCRVESGKAGCFSPKVSRKEKVRRSLRLKFSLGKSSRDVNGCSDFSRYENVGRRLASQQSLKNRIESVKTGLLFSPDTEKITRKGSKKISKSEENLLTPEQLDGTNHRMSWTGPSNSSYQDPDANETSPIVRNLEVENTSLDPGLMVEKSPVTSYELTPSIVHNKNNSSLTGNSFNGDENNLTTETLVKIQKAFSESGSNLHSLINPGQSSITNMGKIKLKEMSSIEYSPKENLFETNDLTVNESKKKHEHQTSKDENSFSETDFSVHQTQELGREAKFYSTQNKVGNGKIIFSKIPEDNLSTQEFTSDEQIEKEKSPRDRLNTKLKENENVFDENLLKCSVSGNDQAKSSSSEQITSNMSKPRPMRIIKQQSLVETCDKMVSESIKMTEHGKVSDHIQWFNKLSLNEPNRTKIKSPLKFQRTPVRQSVRRINSLSEYNRQPIRCKLSSFATAASPLVKSVSCDSALSSCIESTSKDSSISCTVSSPKEQKAMSCKQSNTNAISKSNMNLASKSFSKMKEPPDLVNASLRSRICKEDVVSDGQIKAPLDDLTNHDIKPVVNNMGFSPRINSRVLRKHSERERVWYKGSPKNPIGKGQLLPTSKPVDL
nr:rho GTPase-activating protein 11A isoform X2 [Dasypus novemcinctus]